MTFTWPVMLWLLVLLPVTAYLLWLAGRRRERTAAAYADAHLLSTVVQQAPVAHVRWPLGLQLAALGLLLFSSARPVAAPALPVNKAAVVIALDTSKSMLADDIKPSRLDAAKRIAEEFIKLAPATTQIGLVSFSDRASNLVPPTTDREQLLEALKRVKAAENTSLASAIVSGVKALPGRKGIQTPTELQPRGFGPQGQQQQPAPTNPNAPKVDPANLPPGAILILSDGVSNVAPDPKLAAKFAETYKVKLYTVAVGREGGAVARVQGQDYFIPFDPKSLEQLAQLSPGKHVFPPTKESMSAIYKELGTVIQWEATKLEVSGLLSGLAVGLMLVGGGLSLRWQRRVP